MALANYGQLKTAISAELARASDSDFAASVPDFVDMFEVNVQRDLLHRRQQTNTTLAVAASGTSVTGFPQTSFRRRLWFFSPARYGPWPVKRFLTYLTSIQTPPTPGRRLTLSRIAAC